MTCSTMLALMLEADLDVLDGLGDSELASHLRACPRCQAVASRLTVDTRLLALTVRHPISSARRRSAAPWVVVSGVIAASVAMIAVRAWQRPVASTTATVVAAANTQTGSLAGHIERVPTPSPVRRAVRKPTRVSAPTPLGSPRVLASVAVATSASRISAEAYAPAAAVSAVRLDGAPDDQPLGAGVAADPPAGIRANIIRTSSPAVTVVWLYH
jgi:hypothetical protein